MLSSRELLNLRVLQFEFILVLITNFLLIGRRVPKCLWKTLQSVFINLFFVSEEKRRWTEGVAWPKKMLDNFESKITFEIPTNLDFQTLAMSNNYTVLLTGVGEMDLSSTLGDTSTSISGTRGGLARDGLLTGDAEYDRFIGDVWVGILLTLMIVSSIFCMCACFLYHKFLQWKTSRKSPLTKTPIKKIQVVLLRIFPVKTLSKITLINCSAIDCEVKRFP